MIYDIHPLAWKLEVTGHHSRPVPVVTQDEHDVYRRLSHKPRPTREDDDLRRRLHRKISYRQRFALSTEAEAS